MKFWPIYKDNKLFGEYGSWYRFKFAEYKYLIGQGESIWGEVEALLATGGMVGMLLLVIDKYTGWLCPWWIAILFGIGTKVLKIYIGKLDRDTLRTGQATNEYSMRLRLNPVGNEQLDRIKNIEKKVAPETYQEEHLTYLK